LSLNTCMAACMYGGGISKETNAIDVDSYVDNCPIRKSAIENTWVGSALDVPL
jgi:hypothetical protein